MLLTHLERVLTQLAEMRQHLTYLVVMGNFHSYKTIIKLHAIGTYFHGLEQGFPPDSSCIHLISLLFHSS